MGGPFEGAKKMLDVKGFSTPENVVLPNDDLDLQLVWLEAVKRLGVKNVNARTLGEFWLSFIGPYWNEYGRGKLNMKMGIMPPLSGDAFNNWKHSNGGWIRTEIWACLAPGAPDIAARYAYEDASVDHGMGEGTVAAIFLAAMESAAFAEHDIFKIINIALSKIDDNSRIAKSVKYVLKCYEQKTDYKEVRNGVLELNKDIGSGWFEAPSNVAFAIIGLLWGGGDFKKSMIYTLNCGDDTDCTAGFVGSILGIMGGTNAIPGDWKKHIGDKIETVAIIRGVCFGCPETCTELTDTVLKYADVMLCENHAAVEITDGETEIPSDYTDGLFGTDKEETVYFPKIPYSYRIDFDYMSAIVIHDGDPYISPNETKKIKVRFINNTYAYGNMQHYLNIRVISADGMNVKCPKSLLVSRWSPFDVDFIHDNPVRDIEVEITAGEEVETKNRVVIEACAEGRSSIGYIPITFMGV